MPKVSIYEGADTPGARRTRCEVGWAKGYNVQVGVTHLAEGLDPTGESVTVDPEAVPFAVGGLVTGPGEPGSDQVPAQLSAGEYVMSSSVGSVGFVAPGGDVRPAWRGHHMHLSRSQVNDLIRVLREARDAAYGKDE